MVLDRTDGEDDPFLQKARVDVVGTLAAAALLDDHGDQPQALRQLIEARERFAQALNVLMQGGRWAEVNVPASPDAVMPTLEPLSQAWDGVDRDLQQVLEIFMGTCTRCGRCG